MTKAPGSIVERASERLRRSAPPAPSPLRGPVAAHPPPALRYRTALEITLDRRRLARAGIF